MVLWRDIEFEKKEVETMRDFSSITGVVVTVQVCLFIGAQGGVQKRQTVPEDDA